MDDTIATASLQWLSEEDSSTDPARVQQRLSAKRQPDSGTWLLNSSKFKQWLADEQQILLLVGPPGAGKSVLSSLVVDTLIETFEASSRKHTVYLYCGYNQGQGPDQLCRSILLQLARRSTLTATHIEGLSQSFEQDPSTLSTSQLSGLLTHIITPGSKVYIVLDGWDALSNSTRRVFLAHLFELRKTHLISLFFTSRVRPDATKPFSGYPSLGFDRAIVNGDIEKYIMERQWAWPLQTNRRFIFELSRAIVKTSGGSFLFANLALDLLAKTGSLQEAKQVLRELQPSMKHLYKKIFDKIDELPKKERKFTQDALAWLVFARAPLKGLQLRHALATKAGTYKLTEDQIPEMEEILALCGSLVTYEKETDTSGLSHDSVSEFVRETVLEWELVTVASGCLTYLSFDTFGAGRCESNALFDSRLTRYPLYAYAASYWGDHLGDLPLEAASQAMLPVKARGHRRRDHDQSVDPQYSGFHLAAYFGLGSITTMLLEDGQRPNSKDYDGRTPLWLATEFHEDRVMDILTAVDRRTFTLMLDKGERDLAYSLLEVTGENIRDSRRRTPLHISAIHSDLELMQRSIDCCVDMNAKDTDGYTAIDLALQNNAVPAIDLLLRHGADTSTVNCNQWLEAYQKSSPHIVELSRQTSGPKEVRFPTKEEVKSIIPLRRKDTQRLIMCPDVILSSIIAWPGYKPADEYLWAIYKGQTLQHMCLPLEEDPEEDPCIQHFVLVSIPVQSIRAKASFKSRQDNRLFEYETSGYRICWTMVATQNAAGKDHWTTVDYFSTLEIGSIPDSGTAFFCALVTTVSAAWIRLCNNIDRHLARCRPEVLTANGEDSKLIVRLLGDANTWIGLRQRLDNQVRAIREFCVKYSKYSGEDEDLSTLSKITDTFWTEVSARLNNLDASSAALVQLEFNLTSIREAQKSTQINRSMKRLTWVTFIFLPLTFVSGLFGMNVNVLANNPPWWWYIVFATVILGLTVVIWIIFKRFRGLEDHLESWWNWLTRSHGKEDEEMGSGAIGKQKHS